MSKSESGNDGWVLSAVTNNKFLAAAILAAILGGVALGKAQAVTDTRLEIHIQQDKDERTELNATLRDIQKDIKRLLEQK